MRPSLLSFVATLSLRVSTFALSSSPRMALARGAPSAVRIPGTLDPALGCAANCCSEINNRTLSVFYGTTGTQTENDTVANWRNVKTCGS
ncbi:MAG: hypothetical protein JOZ41_10355 [Chloroflexi bacterium]|nr:hypothetical protein [Chloroflexota bacterium]